MTISGIFATVLMMGFTCSFGCGTVNTPFLVGSLLGDSTNIAQSKRAIMLFSLGKVLSLMVMGALTAIFGSLVLSAVQTIYPNATIWVIRFATFCFGVNILYGTVKKEFLSRKAKADTSHCGGASVEVSPCGGGVATISPCGGGTVSTCGGATAVSGCGGCKSSCPSASMPEIVEGKPNITYFLAGLLYATIPCGPMLTTLTYASTMNIFTAMTLLGLFGLVNSLVPVFLFASLVGLANTEFHRNSAEFLKYIRLSGGVILIYAAFFQVY